MTEQLTLDGLSSRPVARRSDPDTSHAAAASVQRLRASQLAVLHTLAAGGPMTDEQLAFAYANRAVLERLPRMSPSGLRTRRAELMQAALVEDSGHRQLLTTGRRAIVWRLTDAGRRLAYAA